MADYSKMDLPALEQANQRLDAQIQKLRAEKRDVSRYMDRVIHRQNASARWNEMSMEERMALKDIAAGG